MTRPTSPTRTGAFVPALIALIIGALTLPLAFAGPAMAAPEAQIDQRIRPNFGGLITPPLKRHRPDRYRGWGSKYRWGREGYRYSDYYPDYQGSQPPYRVFDSLTVDCADLNRGPTPVSDAVQALRDGGILYIRSRGGVCNETVYIDHPVILAGEGIPTFASGANPAPATFTPLPGNACVRVAPGVRGVELRDLTFTADQGGRSACIESWDADIALIRVKVRYGGDSSAVYASGGRLIIRESNIDGRTYDAAVAADAAVVEISRTRIIGEQAALDIAPGGGESTLYGVGLIARTLTEPGSVGLTVRGLHSGGGELKIRNAVICGWRVGVNLDRGASVDIKRSHICNAVRGVNSEGARLDLAESAIQAADIGVYVSGGQATIVRNRLYDVDRAGVYVERGTQATVEDNWVFSDDCRRFGWGGGQYCVPNNRLSGSLRDRERYWRGGDRDYWDMDGYDQGYMRDGAPTQIAPPPPPCKGWRCRRGDRR